MVMIIRVSTLFAVVVIAAKAGLFVADDGANKNGILGLAGGSPVEKKVSRLIDEGVRRRAELEEAADGVANMAQAIALSAMYAIVRVIQVAGRTWNQTAVAVGAATASVISSRALRSVLALVGRPYRTETWPEIETI